MLSIRPATADDADSLANIFLASRRDAFFWNELEDFFLSDFAEQTQGEVIHLAEDETGRPVAFVSVWVPDRFVHHLFVEPGHQAQGAGSLLLESLASWLPFPHGLKCLALNTKALGFYRSLGWTEISRGRDSYGEYLFLQKMEP